MHYSGIVLLPSMENLAGQVERSLAPHEENENGGKWDWYQIGGRWTGLLDGYKPDEDEDNIVECNLCNGTGTRLDIDCSRFDGCNGCHGKGKHPVYPTRYKKHFADILKVSEIPRPLDEIKTYFVVTPDKRWHEKETWTGEKFEKNEEYDFVSLMESYQDHYAVVVDCHG